MASLDRAPLEIAVAQPACVAHDVARNAEHHAAAIRSARARVVVFPELSLTGYEFDAKPVPMDDPCWAAIVDACAATDARALVGAVVGSVSSAAPAIGIVAVDAHRATLVYRKVWLGSAEAEHFAPGDAAAVYEIDGWRLGLAVCRDTGIVEHQTATVALGVDAYVAGVLEFATEASIVDERAERIARHHRVWVAIASFAGSTGEGYRDAAGRSGIWAPDGTPLARAGTGVGEVARAVLR